MGNRDTLYGKTYSHPVIQALSIPDSNPEGEPNPNENPCQRISSPRRFNHPESLRTTPRVDLFTHDHETERTGQHNVGTRICGYFTLLLNNRLVNIYVALK